MSSRRTTLSDGSLELLLDTITNAFGGILFLAILVVVLLKGTGQRIEVANPTTELDLTTLQAKLQQVEAELSQVDTEIKAAEAISANLADPSLKSTLAKLAQQRKLRDELAEEATRLSQRLTQTQKNLDEFESQDKALTDQIASEIQNLEALQGSMDQERAKRRIKSPFPEERAAAKDDYSVTMRYGRWYVNRSDDGLPNLVDFAVLDTEGTFLTVTPKPYRGIAVVEGQQLSSPIVSSLRSKNPDHVYVCISVWDDSYDQFQLVREYLVGNGFEYRLIAVTEGDEVSEGYVPNPQVQ